MSEVPLLEDSIRWVLPEFPMASPATSPLNLAPCSFVHLCRNLSSPKGHLGEEVTKNDLEAT